MLNRELTPIEKTALDLLQKDDCNISLSNIIHFSVKQKAFVGVDDVVATLRYDPSILDQVAYSSNTLGSRKPVTVSVVFTLAELREHYKKMRAEKTVLARQSKEEAFDSMTDSKEKKSTSPLGLSSFDWIDHRTRLLDLYKNSQKFTPERHVKCRDDKIVCNCVQQMATKDQPCDHIMFTFLSGMDKIIFGFDKISSTQNLSVLLPIGYGQYYVNAQVGLAIDTDTEEPDKDFFLIGSQLDKVIQIKLGLSIPPFVIGRTEGTLSYIRYLEDLLRETVQYTSMLTAINPVMYVIQLCGRTHREANKAALVAALRPSNPHRENWLIANAACLLLQNTCLSCFKLMTQINDVPSF